MFKLTHAKYPLKFCAVGLYLILIGTCLPTAFTQTQAEADETHLLYVNKVTPLYVSLWTGAVLFAPKSLENIEVIFLYPIDAVEESDTRNIGNWLWGSIDNDRQLVIRRPSSSDIDDIRGELSIVTESQIQTLPEPGQDQVYWTSKPRWEEAINWAAQESRPEENFNPLARSNSAQ